MDHMFWQFKPNLCKEWIFIFIFIFLNICILETKNLIAKQKKMNPKKTLKLSFIEVLMS